MVSLLKDKLFSHNGFWSEEYFVMIVWSLFVQQILWAFMIRRGFIEVTLIVKGWGLRFAQFLSPLISYLEVFFQEQPFLDNFFKVLKGPVYLTRHLVKLNVNL